jgi:MYXO-CTERM domain-containing protein
VVDPVVQVSVFNLGAFANVEQIVSGGGRFLLVQQGADGEIPRVRGRFVGADCSSDPSGDADGDAVCDAEDNCLGVSNFGQEDTDLDLTGNACDGCPADPTKTTDVDTNGDGALDCMDGCLDDPSKDAPGHCGCGVSETLCPSGGGAGGQGGSASESTGGEGDEGGEGGEPGGKNTTGGTGPKDTSDQGAHGDNESNSGCGCRTAGGTGSSGSAVVLLLAGLGLMRRIRLRAA